MPKFNLYFAGGSSLQADKTLAMGILNATPDSFSDGGALADNTEARIRKLLNDGADILDVGGESTRPNHQKVEAREEIARILPVIKSIRKISATIPISVDTQKAIVAEQALQAGASFINDVSGLSDPDMAKVIQNFNCSIILMRNKSIEGDIISGCKNQLQEIIDNAHSQGLSKDKILFDPGLGFGNLVTGDYKSLPGSDPQANLSLVVNINKYSHDLPVVIGASRKRFIGDITGVGSSKDRDAGSLAVAILARQANAAIVRVHNVADTSQAFKVLDLV